MKINYTDEQTEAMKRLYGQFVKAGDLVFNVGANVGTRTQIFVDLGCEVIALEPQPAIADVLRERYKAEPKVHVIQAAAGGGGGMVKLMLCTDNQLATCAPGWAESLADRWPMEKWQEAIDVMQVTLHSLIYDYEYGLPDFIKIDVEGYEREVIRGLSQKVDVLCFEATIPYVEPAIECVDDLSQRLGFTRFNYIVQETMKLVLDGWVPAEMMKEILRSLPESTFYVDVFAR